MENDSLATKLKELFELHKSGAITKEEFEKLKQQMLENKEPKHDKNDNKRHGNLEKKSPKPIQWLKILGIFLIIIGILFFLLAGIGLINSTLHTLGEIQNLERTSENPRAFIILLFSAGITVIGFKLLKGRVAIIAEIVAGALLMIIGVWVSLTEVIYLISSYNQPEVPITSLIVTSILPLIIWVVLFIVGFKLLKRKAKKLKAMKNQDVSVDLKKRPTGKMAKIAAFVGAIILILAIFFIWNTSDIEWNESKASQKIMTELKKQPNWTSWHHRIVGFKQISLDQKNVMVAIAISNETETSGYQGDYSIFEFDKSKRWKLGNKKFAFTYAYDSDSYAILDKIHIVSNDNYGIEIESGGSAMGGRFSMSKEIYSFLDGKLEVIFSEEKKWQNSNRAPIFELDFEYHSDDYYDIEVVDNEGRYRNYTKYKFDGLRYEKVED